MDQQQLTQIIVEEILCYFSLQGQTTPAEKQEQAVSDILSELGRNRSQLQASDPQALERMKKRTQARIGVGKVGARLDTQTMLTLRADHANARDAVLADVDEALLESQGLFTVQTLCRNKDEFLTRPDMGRLLSDDAIKTLQSRCKMPCVLPLPAEYCEAA